MSGGNKRILINLRERATSSDINRAQAFQQAERAELMRFMMNLRGGKFNSGLDERGASLLLADIPTVVGDPLDADVFAGLVVTPIVGTTSLHISPGVIGMQDPDGQAGSSDAAAPNPDDSSYKMVVDLVGVQTNGVHMIAPSAGSGIRIDIIECRRNPNVVIETDTRDVFNLGAGQFLPTPGTEKVVEGQLEFRVRQGSGAGGWPGTVQGWVPLCIAAVPVGGGATTDDVDFWDVRPLVKDRVRQPFRSDTDFAKLEQQVIYADLITNGAENRIGGYVWSSIEGYRAGGRITRGIPGADQDYIDVIDSDWHENGLAIGPFDMYFLWLLFPFELPRWVRYNRTPDTGLRFPNGMRGIMLVSSKPPLNGSHNGRTNATGISVPDFLAGGVPTLTGSVICVASAFAGGINAPNAFVADGEWITPVLPSATISPPTGGSGNATDEYTYVANVHYPEDARRFKVSCTVRAVGVAGNDVSWNINVRLRHPGTSTNLMVIYREQGSSVFPASGNFTKTIEFEVPRIMPEGPTSLLDDTNIEVEWNFVGNASKSVESSDVSAWRTVD